MQTFARGLSMRRSISPSSPNLPPIVPPWPAEFSKIISASSGVSASTSVAASQICSNTASSPMPLWLPVWKMTPRAPMRPAMFSAAAQRAGRCLEDLRVGAGEVHQVLAVDEHRTDARRGHRLAELLAPPRRRASPCPTAAAPTRRSACTPRRSPHARSKPVCSPPAVETCAPIFMPRASASARGHRCATDFKCATAPPAGDHAGHGALVRRRVVRRSFDRRHTRVEVDAHPTHAGQPLERLLRPHRAHRTAHQPVHLEPHDIAIDRFDARRRVHEQAVPLESRLHDRSISPNACERPAVIDRLPRVMMTA